MEEGKRKMENGVRRKMETGQRKTRGLGEMERGTIKRRNRKVRTGLFLSWLPKKYRSSILHAFCPMPSALC